MKMNAQRGFTIIELITTVALVAVLLTMAIPGFSRTIEQNQLSTQVNKIFGWGDRILPDPI